MTNGWMLEQLYLVLEAVRIGMIQPPPTPELALCTFEGERSWWHLDDYVEDIEAVVFLEEIP